MNSVLISTPIFLGIANHVRVCDMEPTNTSEAFGRRTKLLITPPKVQPVLIGSQLLIGQGNRVKSISLLHEILGITSMLKAILSSSCHWYKLIPLEWLQWSSVFCPVAAKSIFAKTGPELNQNVLGRFAPSPQCLTVLTYLSLNLQPQPRTWGSTVSPPQTLIAMGQPGSWA